MDQCLVARSMVTAATGSLGKGLSGTRSTRPVASVDAEGTGCGCGCGRGRGRGPKRTLLARIAGAQEGCGSAFDVGNDSPRHVCTRVLKGSSRRPWEQTWAWEYLRQTTAMTTTATTKTSPAVAEPTMRGSCSWSCWALEPVDREGPGEWRDGKYGLGHGQAQRARTSLACGFKLSRAAVLPIASNSAGTDLHHVAGVGPQPIQLH